MEARYSSVLERIEHVLAQHRQQAGAASLQEVDDLYTDACATVLSLESELLEVDRRLAANLVDTSEEALVIKRSRDLARRRMEVNAELGELRGLVDGLSTAAEWLRDPAAAEVDKLID